MLTHYNRPKVVIKLKNILCQNIIPCFFTSRSSDQSLLSSLNFQFLNILADIQGVQKFVTC